MTLGAFKILIENPSKIASKQFYWLDLNNMHLICAYVMCIDGVHCLDVAHVRIFSHSFFSAYPHISVYVSKYQTSTFQVIFKQTHVHFKSHTKNKIIFNLQSYVSWLQQQQQFNENRENRLYSYKYAICKHSVSLKYDFNIHMTFSIYFWQWIVCKLSNMYTF